MTASRRQVLQILHAYPLTRMVADYPQQQLNAVPLVGTPGSRERLESIRRRRAVRSRIVASRKEALQVEVALQALTPVQRLVLDKLCIHPATGNADRLCQLLGCEKSTVYRHRDKALKLVTTVLRAVPADNAF